MFFDINFIIENVEHCGGEPERADTGVAIMSQMPESMSDETSSKFAFLVFSAS